MKLLIMTQFYPPEMGAPQSRLSELSTGLKALGWDVKVVTAMPNYPTGKIFNKYRNKLTCNDTHNGVLIKRFWMLPSNSTRTLPRILSMLSFSIIVLLSLPHILRYKPDYILVESPPLTLALSAWFLSKLSGINFILNVSDLWPLSARELGAINEGFLYRLIEKFENFLYKGAFLCTGQSQEIIDYVIKKGSRRAFLFRNGVDTKRFNIDKANKDYVSIRLVYAGLLGVAQGILSICEAVDFKGLGIEFHIYGTGTERVVLEKFVLENPNSNIFLHEPVSRDEIPRILKKFDGTIIPLIKNIYGAVPSKIYEAMAAGLPILFSGYGEGAEIVQQFQVGWVSGAGEFKQLQKNIADFAHNTGKRELFAKNGIKSAQDIFERSIQIRNLHNYLQDLHVK